MEIKDQEKSQGAFSTFLHKASNVGKKAIDEIQKGAKNASEQRKKQQHEQRLKKYNPLFPEEFKSPEYAIPNLIKIVDDAVRRDIDVCEGAIGWTENVNDVEVLHLYDEFVKESGITFVPAVKIDAVYCVDSFERTLFINAEAAFEKTINEKLAELEHVAYSLGAKSCSVEIAEIDTKVDYLSMAIAAKNPNVALSAEGHSMSRAKRAQSGKNVSLFEGHSNPQPPTLKWFANDENILGLINMRCAGENAIRSKILEIKCSSAITMSRKTACAVDKLLKGKASLERKAENEHRSKLIFEIEF